MICERHLIDYCAPTLASLKTGNLFRIPCRCHEALETSLQQLRRKLEPKGVSLEVIHHYPQNVLVYVYRPVRLQQDLKQPGAAKLLREYGYEGTSVEQALAHLKKRIAAADGFPHEIGLFLGYPLGDVMGFIENRGKNCKCVGCWKVYCDECEAQKMFARFDKCCAVYRRLFAEGRRSLCQLTVAA